MNCRECKKYESHVVEVFYKKNNKPYWLCFHCWAITKDYKLTLFAERVNNG
jgi:hypothetical protein